MPVRYVIDKQRRLVVTVGEDIVTFAEVKLHQDKLTTDPDLDPTFNQFIDLTTVKEFAVSVEEAKTLARRAVLSAESRRAVVASEKSVFGMFRLMQPYHEMTAGHSHIGIFYDRDEALKWLGVKENSRLF